MFVLLKYKIWVIWFSDIYALIYILNDKSPTLGVLMFLNLADLKNPFITH